VAVNIQITFQDVKYSRTGLSIINDMFHLTGIHIYQPGTIYMPAVKHPIRVNGPDVP
jgi:hypothetical protein